MTNCATCGTGQDSNAGRLCAACESSRLAALHHELIHAIGRICPPWLNSQAEDLAQAAILRVITHTLREETGNSEISTSYLRKMAYSAVIDEIQTARKKRERPSASSYVQRTPELPEEAPTPSPAKARPPGSSLRRWAESIVSPSTYTFVIEPTLSDLAEEHDLALTEDRPWKALWVRLRGYGSFWVTAAAHLVAVVGRRVARF